MDSEEFEALVPAQGSAVLHSHGTGITGAQLLNPHINNISCKCMGRQVVERSAHCVFAWPHAQPLRSPVPQLWGAHIMQPGRKHTHAASKYRSAVFCQGQELCYPAHHSSLSQPRPQWPCMQGCWVGTRFLSRIG